jgi:hypothetical protein
MMEYCESIYGANIIAQLFCSPQRNSREWTYSGTLAGEAGALAELGLSTLAYHRGQCVVLIPRATARV